MTSENAEYPLDEGGHRMVRDLSASLDEETTFLSGGFQNLEGFQAIIGQGESALPVLLSDIKDDTIRTGGWWRLQAVWTIAAQLDLPIEFPEDSRGKYDAVKAIVEDWGQAQGYLEAI